MMDALFWSVILLVVGIGLIVLELFIPSAGLLGVLAAVALAGAVVMGFTGGWASGMIMLVTTLVLIPVILASAVRWWPHTPIGRLIVLHAPESAADVLPDTAEYRDLPTLVGRRGVAKTKMLPSGAVVIDGKTYDAVSDGTAIDPGQPIRVKAIRTNRIIVTLAPSGFPREPAGFGDLLDQPAENFGLKSLDEPPA